MRNLIEMGGQTVDMTKRMMCMAWQMRCRIAGVKVKLFEEGQDNQVAEVEGK